MLRIFTVIFLIFGLAACEQQAQEPDAAIDPPVVETYSAPVNDISQLLAAAATHPNRSEADRNRDEQRKPEQILAFAGVEAGMTVLDVFSGGGWYSELLSYVVGEDGEVWAHNPLKYYEAFGDEAITNRLAGDRLPNVLRHDREVEAMELPADTFDFAVMGMVFHDLHWLTDDVNAVLLQLCEALKPGAHLLITDHAAPEGTGVEYALEFRGGKHRIEEAFAIEEIEAAGFELIATSDLLRVPEDDRTQPFFQMDGAFTDRFVLLFKKSEQGD